MTDIVLREIESLGLAANSANTEKSDLGDLHLITSGGFANWQTSASPSQLAWIAANGFSAKSGASIMLPPDEAASAGGGRTALGIIDADGSATIWDSSAIASNLPQGSWAISPDSDAEIDFGQVCLGWALAQYQFNTYRADAKIRDSQISTLILPPALVGGNAARRLQGLARGVALCRDLINSPPNHMTPAGLETTAHHLAKTFDATITVNSGDALARDYPAINIVGRAAEIAPRLIDLSWGDTGPKITLIGKGITFDSGGLDLKPSKAMEMMKKDMGGAATVLGLATAIMTAGLPVRLRVLIPAAENAVSSQSMRPLDVIETRAGIAVEVGNTDAEGRLVLADAITLACEDEPDFMIDFATLTGAARVALGTELPALFCNKDTTASAILDASNVVADPLWRLPLFDPYERHLDGGYVTLSSTGASGYGGAITAALFLRRFAGKQTNWAHIDVMAWNLGGRPGRPKGGEAMGLRAIFTYIESLAVAK
jgi:leucyl aminopeptidase